MKAKPTRRARTFTRTPNENSWGKSRYEPRPQPHGGALVSGAGRGPAPGAPNAGRPRKAVRLLFRDILVTEGIEAARAILLGEPDRSGNVPTFDQRLAWFSEIAAIGFNEKVRLARASSATAVMQSGMQVILQGGPAGNLQPI